MSKRKRRGRGEGSIYQRADGTWTASISLGYNAEGRRVRKTVYGKTKKEVREKLLAVQRDALSGLPVKPEILTVDQHFADWFRIKGGQVRDGELKQKTLGRYEDDYRRYIKPDLGHVKLKDLDYRRINALYEKLDDQGLTRSVSMTCFLLRSALEDATRKGIVPLNQAKLAGGRRQKRTEARYMNQEEVKRFLDAAKGERLEDALILGLHTGLRPGELLGLPWDAIDWEGMNLTVAQALNEDKGKVWIETVVKSESSYRIISLSVTAIAALKRQRKRQAEEQLAFGEGWNNEHNLVFTDTKGGLPRKSNVRNRLFRPVCEKAGLSGVVPHTLRHTHASILIFQGVDAKTISVRLGHSDVAFTLQVYGHLFPGQDEKAAAEVDAFFEELL